MLAQVTNFRSKNTHRLRVKGQKKIFHTNDNQKGEGVAIIISDNTECYKKHKKCYKKQRTALYNDKRIKSPKRQNNYRYLQAKPQISKVQESNSDRIEWRKTAIQ